MHNVLIEQAMRELKTAIKNEAIVYLYQKFAKLYGTDICNKYELVRRMLKFHTEIFAVQLLQYSFNFQNN